jgi:hypothetical protein
MYRLPKGYNTMQPLIHSFLFSIDVIEKESITEKL